MPMIEVFYTLMLNDMRLSNIEILDPVAQAEDPELLKNYVENHKAAELWREDTWGKVFKKGSPLEWFNEPYLPINGHDPFGHVQVFERIHAVPLIKPRLTLVDKMNAELKKLEKPYRYAARSSWDGGYNAAISDVQQALEKLRYIE